MLKLYYGKSIYDEDGDYLYDQYGFNETFDSESRMNEFIKYNCVFIEDVVEL
jgi:hypothetical protein